MNLANYATPTPAHPYDDAEPATTTSKQFHDLANSIALPVVVRATPQVDPS